MAKLMVLVADQSHARLYTSASLKEPFAEVEDFSNAVARHHEGDLVTDAPGRSSSAGDRFPHPMGTEQSARQHNLEQFARLLIAELNRQLDSQHEPKLYLIAPPKFLGVLRQQLEGRAQRLIAGELDKNITDISPAKLAAYISEMEQPA